MNSDPWGGSEEIWYKVALEGISRGYDITCLLYYWKEKEAHIAQLIQQGASIVYIPNKGRSKRNTVERIRYEWVTRLQQQLFLKRFPFLNFDYVLFNQGGFMELANSPWRSLKPKGLKYSIVYHNYAENFSFKKAKANALISWLYDAQYNFFASQKASVVLSEQLGIATIPQARVFVNPVSDVVAVAAKSEQTTRHVSGDVSLFVVLAALDVQRKAQDNLIKAFAAPVWRERLWELKLYGSGKDYAYLDSLIDEYNLRGHIQLMGKTTAVHAVLEEADCFIQLTHIDAMPIALVEALAMSKPALVSNVGDMALWVRDGFNGWVAKDASVETIQTMLEIVWAKRADWPAMGAHSRSVFKEKYPDRPEKVFFDLFVSDNN